MLVLTQIPSSAAAQISSEFLRIDQGSQAVYYQPLQPGDLASIAILVMHSDADYLNFSMCTEMSQRGFRVLCANVRSAESSLDDKLLDVANAVRFLRRTPGVKKVVLMGHSGGGTLMSAYQNIAQNGVSVCQDSAKISPCNSMLADMPPADGLMLLDANWGISTMMLFSLDPAVQNEADPSQISSSLDLFNPDNGFQTSGAHYSPEFVHRFQQAQGQRNHRLITSMQRRLALIQKGEGIYLDDEPLTISGAAQGFMNNKLFAQDLRLMSHTQSPWPLLHADGHITRQIVHSVRQPANPTSLTRSLAEGALRTTVRHFLSNYAVRTTADYGYDAQLITGIDWRSSYNTPVGNIGGVTVPLLLMGMTGNWEYLAAETLYKKADSQDKQLIFVEGASHLFTTCQPCESFPGQFGDTLRTTYDYVAGWLRVPGRFLPETLMDQSAP
ncbi:MAG: alpha/beta hydrolase family protein [Aeromonadaceae bacterium]